MNRKGLLFTAVAALGLVLASCSDEIKLQNTLTKDSGLWNLDEIKSTTVFSNDPDNPINTQDFNVGEVSFYDSCRGVWITYDTMVMLNVAYYFEWENTANSVILNFEDFPDTETEYAVNEVSKDEQIWTSEDVETVGSVTVTTTTELRLVREEEIANK